MKEPQTMAADSTVSCAALTDAEFRKESRKLSFLGTLYSALSTAAFIGVLTKVVGASVDAFGGTGDLAFRAMDVFSAPSMGIMGGFATVGVGFTYLAQSEWTELGCLRDEHMAKKNAEQMAIQQHHELSPTISKAIHPEHYENPGRKDGKTWQQAIEPKTAELRERV